MAILGIGLGSLLLQLAALILLAASVARTGQALRLGIAFASFVSALTFALVIRDSVGTVWSLLLLLANIAHLYLAGRREAQIPFSEEERRMVEVALPKLDRSQARHLLDQGVWISGRAGEQLTAEGEPVSHLFYLSQGRARVLSAGKEIATLAAPGLVGEMTVLSKQGATGTVLLQTDARFWCVSADALRRFLDQEPAIRVALENSFAGSLVEKLKLSNRALAEREG